MELNIKNISLFILIFLCLLLTSCDFFELPYSKEEIFNYVKNNQDILNRLPNELLKQNLQLSVISTAKKKPLPEKYKDIKELYLTIVNGKDSEIYVEIKNDFLSEVFNIECISSINSYLSDDMPDIIYFDCGSSGYASVSKNNGFYYIENNIPVPGAGIEGELKKSGNGWIQTEKDSDNTYYTEIITNNWYYYEEHS